MKARPVLAAILLFGGSAFAQRTAPPATLPNGLVRVDSAKADLAYVSPGADWTKYKTVRLVPLEIPPKARDGTPSNTNPVRGESYVLRDKDVAELQQVYDKAMREALATAGLTPVETAGPDTLVIAGQITQLLLVEPIESTRIDRAAMVYSTGAGAMTITTAFSDGASGKVMAQTADRRYPTDVWGLNNRVSNVRQARIEFEDWGRQVANRLNELRAIGPKSN